jgi:hypothetical protein
MRFSPVKLSVASALLGLSLFGCTDVDSTNLNTSGIRAELTVTGRGDGTASASAGLYVQDSTLTFVELQEGDELTATTGDETKTMEKSELFGVIDYYASFADADAEGTAYTIAFNRDSAESAPGSTATLPAKFNLTAPEGDALSYSRADDDIVVTYDNSGKSDEMSYSLDGDCLNVYGKVLDGDPGTFTIPKGTLTLKDTTTTAPTSCQVTVRVSRTRAGTLDPAFGEGHMSGVQMRTFTFSTMP